MIALRGGFISTFEILGSLLVGLGVALENRKTSGENELLPENLKADVWSKVSQQTYSLKLGCTVQSVTGNFIFISRPIGLIISIFSVFEIMEPQGNYMEKLYNPGEYKLTWMLCCYFSSICIKHAYFATLMKYILELLETLFVETCVD